MPTDWRAFGQRLRRALASREAWSILGDFEVLRRELTRLRAIMGDLLTYGKPMSLVPTPTVPGVLVREAVAQCAGQASRHGVTLATAIADPLPPIAADPRRLVEALRNLVENAIQHAPRGSEVTVSCEPMLESGWQWISFTVQDRGSGFRAEDLAHVFEPFFTRRAGGTGLGLAMVQRIVDEHGGRVAAANRDGGGARLRMQLPVTTLDRAPRLE
jgi:signal transduction histidine kinase